MVSWLQWPFVDTAGLSTTRTRQLRSRARRREGRVREHTRGTVTVANAAASPGWLHRLSVEGFVAIWVSLALATYFAFSSHSDTILPGASTHASSSAA